MGKPSINIFVGHFGSGKTEMAINYALKEADQGELVTIVDLDIVNPFYRSSEVKDIFNQHGVMMISPNFAGTASDVPSLPPSIQGVFDLQEGVVIFDVGGDNAGATALSRYKESFERVGYKMFFVINTCRPLTSFTEDIMEYMAGIEKHSRLKITGLVSNTNLAYETNIPIIIDGIKVVEMVSKEKKVKLNYICAPKALAHELPDEYQGRVFPLELFMTKWNN